ncbi:MAG: ferrous iron transport protein B [Bacteroidales bacterium]|nr:ferrous iron transport protein B [Bacteroidales bacterium]
MLLAELKTGSSGVIAKVNGHGSFRKRLIEMGFISGKKVKVILNAPLQDPIEYEIMGYKLSLRREEARMIEVIGEDEALEYLNTSAGETAPIPSGEPYAAATVQLEMEDLADRRHRQIRVALVGNPNCGKTSLFNVASGSREHVGNYSGVTVDAKEGRFSWKGYEIVLIDLPGTYSLSAYSPEELYVRKALIDKTPDVVINVVDASNIERNLYLTTQIIDMNLRTVIALNMYDELISKGDEIDTVQLGRLFGVPVCPTISRSGEGIGQLFDTVLEVYSGAAPSVARHIHINHGTELEQSIDRIKIMLQQDASLRTKYSTRYLAIKYLEHDSDVEKVLGELPFAGDLRTAREQEEARIREVLDTDCESAIVDAKYAFINGALTETYREHRELRPKHTITDKIDAVVANKWAAFPIFILLLYIIFQATFTLGQYPMDWIDAGVAWLGEKLGGLMADGWLKNLLVDGVIAGVGSVLVFLPNILILYFFISLLEDSGYMARAAFIVDKMMHRLGLHGKSFIPMVMGFGCNVPAIMACRTIESRKSRLITIAIIPFMSCAGRLPIFVLFAGAFFAGNAALVLLGIYLLGIVLAVLSAMVIKRFVKDDDLPFVMELPPYRIPTAKAIWRHTWEKGRQYLQKMATTILLCSVVIWFLGYFPRSQELTAATEVYSETLSDADAARVNDLYEQQQADSYIGRLGRAVEPVLAPMGINWKMGVSLLTGVAAKELVVSSLGVMYSQGAKISQGEDLEDDTALQSALARDISWQTALAFMVFVLLYFPCIATFVAIKHETHSWKWAVGTCAYTMIIAWLMSFLTYTVFTL